MFFWHIGGKFDNIGYSSYNLITDGGIYMRNKTLKDIISNEISMVEKNVDYHKDKLNKSAKKVKTFGGGFYTVFSDVEGWREFIYYKSLFDVSKLFHSLLINYICNNSGLEFDSTMDYIYYNSEILNDVVNCKYNKKVSSNNDKIKILGTFVPIDKNYNEMTSDEKIDYLSNCYDAVLLDKGYTFEEIHTVCREIALERWPEKIDINTTSHHR